MKTKYQLTDVLRNTGQRFYEVEDQILFPLYGVTGTVTSTALAYLIDVRHPSAAPGGCGLGSGGLKKVPFGFVYALTFEMWREYEDAEIEQMVQQGVKALKEA
jgi:hypothetical protein